MKQKKDTEIHYFKYPTIRSGILRYANGKMITRKRKPNKLK